MEEIRAFGSHSPLLVTHFFLFFFIIPLPRAMAYIHTARGALLLRKTELVSELPHSLLVGAELLWFHRLLYSLAESMDKVGKTRLLTADKDHPFPLIPTGTSQRCWGQRRKVPT